MEEDAKLFENLFRGATHCYGIYDENLPNNYRYQRDGAEVENYLAHLEGKVSIGIVPITQWGYAKFGALDLDDHKKGGVKKDFDYDKLLKKIKFLKLPLTVFKSKSGGAHCYLLLNKFHKAIDVRHILKKWRMR